MRQGINDLARKALVEAEKVRRKLSPDQTAIIDPVAAAEKLGCLVHFRALNSLEGMYSKEPRPCIVIGSLRPAGRRNFTCAHELGHHVFGDGIGVDEIKSSATGKLSETESLANMFAGFLLMPQLGIRAALSTRKIQTENITPWDIFRLSSQFGVGFTTIVKHMTYALKMLSHGQCEELCSNSPGEIKAQFFIPANSEMILVDDHWKGRALDLQIGDHLVAPITFEEELGKLEIIAEINQHKIFRAKQIGYSRLRGITTWLANIRIARAGYEGLAKYRFLEDNE